MKVVVTGGSGNVGRYVVDELKKFHHEVTVFDVKEPKDKDIAFVKGDMLKIDDCRKAFEGAEAIVHLAAIPHPLNDPPERVFNTNVAGIFSVHQAAADLGIKKVVHASSDSSYGFGFLRAGDFLLPEYLPLDEDHPQRPADCYGLSKKVGEDIAKSFTKRYGMRTITLRICMVFFPELMDSYKSNIEKGKGWLWYNDVRDVAQAFRLALEAKELKNYEVFCICAADNGSKFGSIELAKKFFSDKIILKRVIKGRQSLYDWSKAKALLAYQPHYTLQSFIPSISSI
ncbi:MAG: NAD-dependent epimerase/dehydratase family protein [Clostridia bacterium]|jgi:nucleoside-diphosphate-sugar epimerase|nr:NAD-dependent epimerase/dehydratase family protein [Clostridia bacterium]